MRVHSLSMQQSSSTSTHRPARAFAALLGLSFLAIAAFQSGCVRPLLSPEDERSPFDRYDALRNQQAPQQIEDPYGRRQPNLRGRLSPRTE